MNHFKSCTLLVAVCVVLASAPARTQDAPTWIERSNTFTQQLLLTDAQFEPEDAAQAGLEQFDGKAIDLGPRLSERLIAAEQKQRVVFTAALQKETDPRVKQDLQILISAIDRRIEGTRLNDSLTLDWIDVPQLVFGYMNAALDTQLSAGRQAKALELLQRYTGLYPDTTPLTELARARWADSQGAGKAGPYRGKVEDTLGKTATYIQGIHDLFARAKIKGADQALKAMDQQLRSAVRPTFCAW